MRRQISRVRAWTIVALVFGTLAGCQGYRTEGARTPGEFADDVAIQAAVKTALVRAEGVKGAGINVEVRQSVVTLFGRVGSEQERSLALTTARGVGGVASVVDRLTLVKAE